MLVEKAPQGEVMAFKLTTGEEIIARVLLCSDEKVVVLEHPLAMIMAEDPKNPQQTRVMFTPWLVGSRSSKITVDKRHVVAMSLARQDAADQYNQAIG